MAYPFSEGDVWSGLMPKRKPYYYPSRPSMSGLPSLGNMPNFNRLGPTHSSVRGGPGSPMAGKKGWDKDLLGEVLKDIMGNVDTTPLPGQRVGETNIGELSLLQQAGPEVGDISTSMDRFWKKKLGYA